MIVEKVDVVKSVPEMIWNFFLSPELWELYIKESTKVDFNNIAKIPFFDNDSKKLSKEVRAIPNKTGGIYIYIIENPVMPEAGRYIMYIGRALYTKNENLRKRIQDHYYQYSRGDENERLIRLYDDWAKYVYVLYVPINKTNEEISNIEKELIVSIAPPCNKDYPSVILGKKLSAFQYS